MMEQSIYERAARMARRGVYDHARRLVDHDQVYVFVQNRECERFRLDFDLGHLGWSSNDDITFDELTRRANHGVVEQRPSLFDPTPHLCARRLRPFAQEDVQALARFAGSDFEVQHRISGLDLFVFGETIFRGLFRHPEFLAH